MVNSDVERAKEAYEEWRQLQHKLGDQVVAAEIFWLDHQDDPQSKELLDGIWRRYWSVLMGEEGLDLPEGYHLHTPLWDK